HTRSDRDWSSDVCSSDLRRARPDPPTAPKGGGQRGSARAAAAGGGGRSIDDAGPTTRAALITLRREDSGPRPCSVHFGSALFARSEERRVGKECRSVWWR